jgi:hypothetical protein
MPMDALTGCHIIAGLNNERAFSVSIRLGGSIKLAGGVNLWRKKW